MTGASEPKTTADAGVEGEKACPAGEHTPRWLHWVTRISIVIGLIALVITVWIVGPHTLWEQLRKIGWFFIALIALEIVTSICDATAIYFMADGPGRPSWRDTVVAQLAGRGINSITPGGNLGEAVKVGLLAQRCSPRRIVAAVMYVNLVAVVINFAVIAVCSAATAFMFDLPRAAFIGLLVGAAVAAAIAVGIMFLIKRGMLSTLSNALAHMHIISKKRRQSWNNTLEEVDRRLRGQDTAHKSKATLFIAISQIGQKGLTYATVLAAGYMLSPGQFMAYCSAGVLLGWISTIIPMGLGISEGGNVALFSLIGAPASLGLALALARRVNQIAFAIIGFFVLTADRVASRVKGRVKVPLLGKLKPSASHS
ncbi:MAG TPA: lysylphosphatidylglycerol synthase transmembrane domain-containing protein [Kofleriaceae bacterium]|nr:lysylphosphatidylglycerol synthase transmembrane domain-containing protein [Kofleriaceae bacterium]